MKRIIYILLGLCPILVACTSTSYIAADDVYYWPAAHKKVAAEQTETQQVEYISVQDTVVTIRIKK